MTKNQQKLIQDAERARLDWIAKKAELKALKERDNADRDKAVYTEYLTYAGGTDMPMSQAYAYISEYHRGNGEDYMSFSAFYTAVRRHEARMRGGQYVRKSRREGGRK